MSETVTALNDALFAEFSGEKLVMLGTVDAETNGPTVSAISWVYAVSPEQLRFAIDARSRLVLNIRNNPKVTVTFFGAGSVHTISGTAAIRTESLEDVPFKLVCIDVNIEAVRDSMFYGARISVEPVYEKTYDKRAAEKLDNQVFTAMQKA